VFRRNPHHRLLAPGPGPKTGSGAIRESAEVAEEVDVVGVGMDGTDDDRVDVYVRTCARRLVDGLQCGDDYLLVKMMMMVLLLLVLVMSPGQCVDVRV
jgi:hypothetical protein